LGIQPKIDLIDKESHFVVQAELPGVDKKDLEIDLMKIP
jgi:HSP20 family molecular chaperone IbpA